MRAELLRQALLRSAAAAGFVVAIAGAVSSASAAPLAVNSDPAPANLLVQVKGGHGHGGHGHHGFGGHHDRGRHLGWTRGRHLGWYHH
jgi:hypothetical protein